MKKTLTALAFILISQFATAQTPLTIVRFERDRVYSPWYPHSKVITNFLILSNGDTLFQGSKLRLGKGTMPNGDFQYIATSSNTNEAKLKKSTTLQELEVNEINRKGKEKYGYTYFIVTKSGFRIQFEDAVATGEIIYDNSITKK